jgi:putative phosphoribosyl transferase
VASALRHLRPEQPIVSAHPRGGVVAGPRWPRRSARCWTSLLIRKIGAPDQPELAIAAVVDGADPQLILNENVAASVGVKDRLEGRGP